MNVMAHALENMTSSSANGSWENYPVTGEHMHVTTLFFKELYEMVNLL
jgi:hypothetical protein